MTLDNRGFVHPAEAIKKSMEGIHASMETLRGVGEKLTGVLGVLGLGFAAFRSAEAFTEGLKGAAEAGKELQTLSTVTGQSVKDLVVLKQAFAEAGIGDALETNLIRLQKALGGVNEEGQPTTWMFRQLGLSIDELKNMDATEQFERIGQAINKLGNQADKQAAVMALFGRQGYSMLAMFSNPSAMEEAQKSLGDYGALMQKDAGLFTKITNALEMLSIKMKGFFAGFIDQVGPGLLSLYNKINSLDFTGWGQKLGRAVASLRDAAGPVLDWMVARMRDFQDLTARWANALAAGIQTAINLFRQGNIGEVVSLSLMIGFRTAVDFFSGALKATIVGAGMMLKETFKGAWSFMTDPGALRGIQMAMKGIANEISSAITKGLVAALRGLNLLGANVISDKDANALNHTADLNNKAAEADFAMAGESMSGALDKASDRFAEKLIDAAKNFKIEINNKIGDDPKLAGLKDRLQEIISSAVPKLSTGDMSNPGEPAKPKAGAPASAAGSGYSGRRDAGDQLSKIGLFIGRGGPANDYARRTAVATEKIAVSTSQKHLPSGQYLYNTWQ